MRIYKQADTKLDKRLPDGETLALYVRSLKLYLKDNPQLDDGLADLIKRLPSDREVRQNFSKQECKIIYETLEYLWQKITGSKIISEKEIIKAPETLFGSYWMLSNGILLHGVNHYTIIKQNELMIGSLLGVGGMTMQEYLCSRPNKLIGFIIKCGGIRMFVTKKKELYTQMSPKTYAKWGKNKIRNFDFPLKIVKVIDFKVPYEGWSSGIALKLS